MGADDRIRPRLCENACAILKSALLRKICQRLVNQQTGNLRRNAIFVPALTVKLALKRFHTAWVDFCLSRLTGLGRCGPWKAFVQTSPR